jgi:hypothetical protein
MVMITTAAACSAAPDESTTITPATLDTTLDADSTLAAEPVGSAEEALEMDGWIFSGDGAGIHEGQKYSMYNTDQKAFLVMQERRGANLGWKGSAPSNIVIKRQSGSGPLKCGDIFAFQVDGKEWVMYDHQTFGINLSTRTKLTNPAWYQWKFTSCAPGAMIPLNTPVSLTNTVENDALVGCKRAWGVNMCWANDVKTVLGLNYRRNG